MYVFITGGTGFIGKVLIEKLLRVFDIKRIYLLVRVKNSMSVDERVEHFFKESVKQNIFEYSFIHASKTKQKTQQPNC